jgi:hypothetical protein
LEAIIHVMEGLIYLFNTDLLKLKKRVCNLERQWLAYRTPMQPPHQHCNSWSWRRPAIITAFGKPDPASRMPTAMVDIRSSDSPRSHAGYLTVDLYYYSHDLKRSVLLPTV